MEIEGKNGSKILLKEGVNVYFGRGLGLDSDDRTVSRRHIAFQLHKSTHKDANATNVGFVVTGRNPIWVYSRSNGEIRVYRRSERGKMESGDLFYVSAKNPVWFNLRRIESEGRDLGADDDLADILQSQELAEDDDLELEAVDLTNIDPIKEFGFVVLGHEFDGYPKKMVRDSKNWDWFLDEGGEKSDSDEDDYRKRKKGTIRKRKKGGGNEEDDDDWTGESEEDAEVITKLRKVQKPKYSTRSKDHDKGTSTSKKSQQKDVTQSKEIEEDEEEEEEDEEDETLGGFIVDDEGAEEEKEIDEEEEEEEEFKEEEDEEEDEEE